MKKFTLTLIMLFVATIFIKAQEIEFAPVGAEWHYERQIFNYNNWSYDGIAYDRFRSLDIIDINGWQCKKIELFRNMDCDGNINPSYETRYINQDGKKIYEVIDGERYLLYDFSKQVGEYWLVKHNSEHIDGFDTIFVKEIKEITLADESTRRMFVTSSNGMTVSLLYCTNIIEGIGMDKYVFPFYELMGPPPCKQGEIRCYSIDDYYLITSDTECDYEVTLSINEIESNGNIVVSPTLLSNGETISIESDSEIKDVKIVDMLGRKMNVSVNNTTGTSCQVNMNQKCNSGIYLIIVETQDGHHYEKVVVRS